MTSASSDETYQSAVAMFAEHLGLEPEYSVDTVSRIATLGGYLCNVPDSANPNIRRIQGMVAQSLFAAGTSQLGEEWDSAKPIPESAQSLFDQAFELAYITCQKTPNRRLLPYISYLIQNRNLDDERRQDLISIREACILDLETYTFLVAQTDPVDWLADVVWSV